MCRQSLGSESQAIQHHPSDPDRSPDLALRQDRGPPHGAINCPWLHRLAYIWVRRLIAVGSRRFYRAHFLPVKNII